MFQGLKRHGVHGGLFKGQPALTCGELVIEKGGAELNHGQEDGRQDQTKNDSASFDMAGQRRVVIVNGRPEKPEANHHDKELRFTAENGHGQKKDGCQVVSQRSPAVQRHLEPPQHRRHPDDRRQVVHGVDGRNDIAAIAVGGSGKQGGIA